MRPPSDRRWRAIAAELAELHPDDLANILTDLPWTARSRLEGLIAGYGTSDLGPGAGPPGYSPWLTQAMTVPSGPDGSGVTRATRDALSDVARRLRPGPAIEIEARRPGGTSPR